MPNITQGVTFQSRAIGPHMDDALQARIHDPVWFMARQWQFGEYQGDDAGSPARVDIEEEQAPLTRYHPGDGASVSALAFAPGEIPLETLAEREPLPAFNSRHLGLLVEAGLQFLRQLAANGAGNYRAAYRSHYALPRPTVDQAEEWDADSLRTLELLAGRVPDAVRLQQDLSAALGSDGSGTGPLPTLPAIAPADQSKVRNAARAWLRWFATQGFSSSSDVHAWIPNRMEYGFSVAARTAEQELVLAAPEYHGGRLDWDSFVGQSGQSLGAQVVAHTSNHSLLPSPVTYRGMPASRLWAFEEGRVNLGAIGSNSPDLASMVLVEFALLYGNDWFMAPLEVEVGSFCRIKSMVVCDGFGLQTPVSHYSQVDGSDAPWRMYALTPQTSVAATPLLREGFFFAPALGSVLEGPALEEVLFLRDEMANLAWAVERVVQSRAGRPLDRFEAYQDQRRQEEESAQGDSESIAHLADLVYRLGSTVPDYWIPLLPEEETTSDGHMSTRLRRGAMPRFGPDGVVGVMAPLGTLLRPGQELLLYEEEVPREGARVARACHYTRWVDGSVHLWMGASKRPGRGEGSSGLRFDTVEPV